MGIRFRSVLKGIQNPPIVSLKASASRFLGDPDFVDLSQAVPSYPPPDIILEEIRKKLPDPGSHTYTPDPGRMDLREAICEKLKVHNRISSEPGEIIVTAGANQAYLLAMLTFLDPGDEVILLTPYYFNHHMAITAAGGIPVEVELEARNGFQLDLEKIRAAITVRTRAITLVTPNNPAGSVICETELRALTEIVRDRDLLIISDETYEYFTGPDIPHVSIGAFDEIAEKVITIGSFSKTFSLTGWRVGYLRADQDYIGEMLKIQDIMVICAPNLSQQAALTGLTRCQGWLEEKRGEVDKKVRWLREFEFSNGLFSVVSAGAFFAYVRHCFEQDSFEVCRTILEQRKILCIPGQVSGQSQKGFFRVAIGGVDLEKMKSAFNTLDRFEAGRNFIQKD